MAIFQYHRHERPMAKTERIPSDDLALMLVREETLPGVLYGAGGLLFLGGLGTGAGYMLGDGSSAAMTLCITYLAGSVAMAVAMGLVRAGQSDRAARLAKAAGTGGSAHSHFCFSFFLFFLLVFLIRSSKL